MELYRMIKKDAKRLLRSVWGRSLAAGLIVTALALLITSAESAFLFVFSDGDFLDPEALVLSATSTESLVITVSAAVLTVLLVPQGLRGMKKLHLSFLDGEEKGLSPLFESFSPFWRFLDTSAFWCLLFARTLLGFIVAMTPGTALLWFIGTYMPKTSRTLQLLEIGACLLSVLLILLCLTLWLIFCQRWFLAPYYFAEGNSAHRSFSLSIKATKGRRTAIFGFHLSFFGWAVLSVLILPLLWAVPYYETASAVFARYLMERYERSLAPEQPEE